jgi:uncharacterized protein (DUF849 family)
VLIEVEPGGKDPIQSASAIGRVLDESGIQLPRLQHGMGAEAWPLLEDALARGCDIRVGLEDTLQMPDGSPAHNNGDLVAAAVRLASRVASR